MKLILFFISYIFISYNSTIISQKIINKTDFVDPFMCTSGEHGHTDPAASVPFGMVKPGPDTFPIGYSGYDFSAQRILGFSNTRFSGVGCQGVGGNIRILPFVLTKKNEIIPNYLGLDKSSEVASPGYYSVILDNKIQVELTATRQVAFHKYTFPKLNHAGLIINLASSFVKNNYEKHTIDSNGIISGEISSHNICDKGNNKFYFALTLNKLVKKITSNGSIIKIDFSTKEKNDVIVRCAISVVNAKNAIETLKSQSNATFNSIRQEALNKWGKVLNAIEIKTSNDQLKSKFYSHLYHATQTPFIIQDINGEYRGSDGKKYKSSLNNQFYGWSIWDTFRTKLPLLSLISSKNYMDMMSSLKKLYKQGKVNWSTSTEPFLTVRTEHSIVVLLDALNKNLLNYSLDDIYPQLKIEMENLSFETPDKTLESSYDLWAMSEIAKKLGHFEDAKNYLFKALEYKKTWNKYFKVMGDNADIMGGAGLYQGTLWQYRWFLPFDIKGIQKEIGSKQLFEKQLDYFFGNNLFNVGNEPDIQTPFLYDYTNAPWKTQKLVHSILSEPTINWYGSEKFKNPIIRKVFLNTPEGYITDMDDDAGTLAGWYIFASMGFYPICPGSPLFVLCSPLYEKTTLHFDNGKSFVIQADKVNDKNIYIQSATLNGQNLNKCWIKYNDIVSGGKLIFKMGAIPNKKWGLEDPL